MNKEDFKQEILNISSDMESDFMLLSQHLLDSGVPIALSIIRSIFRIKHLADEMEV